MADSTPTAAEAAAVLTAAELAAAQAVSDAYDVFKAAIAAALATLPTQQGYAPQIRTIGNGVLANISFQMGQTLPALIASYTPAEPAGTTAAAA